MRLSVLFIVFCASAFGSLSPQKFIEDVERESLKLNHDSNIANWINNTFITPDTDYLAAKATEKSAKVFREFVLESRKYESEKLDPDLKWKLELLRLGAPSQPSDPKLAEEYSRITTEMSSDYGKGKYCPTAKNCVDINGVHQIMAESQDPEELKAAWKGWHAVGKGIRKNFERYVKLGNVGVNEMGFPDKSNLWRAQFDMPPDEFSKQVDQLWQELRPLYVELHAYVRTKLREKYGEKIVSVKGPIPAHLLGNIWSQEWMNLYPLVAPKDEGQLYDLTKALVEHKTTVTDMMKYGEKFFISLGFEPLPPTFWERSMLEKPPGRDVVCHASAWDLDNDLDVRIKMCTRIKDEDFRTVHHELGHIYYDLSYRKQPFLFRAGANGGFHEAIGDTIDLSITPEYLNKIGLVKKIPDGAGDIPFLLKHALDKVAFLPFGIAVDQWRWRVFSGDIKPNEYNKTWWEIRKNYQGIIPPVPRSESDFDPGSKYHIAADTPYSVYFVAAALQYQLHEALTKTAGCKQALHRCSIFESKSAGKKLRDMLAEGHRRPWQDILEQSIGTRQISGRALRAYYAPLEAWLKEQNKNAAVGWE